MFIWNTSLMLFLTAAITFYSSDWKGWGRPTHFLSEMLQNLQKFLQAKLVLANASLQKSKENSKTEKKHLTCSCNWHFFEHMLLHSPNPLSLLPPWHTVESSSGVSQPEPQPCPVFSAASTSCLQEGQAATPSFHFLWCSLSLGVLEWTGPPQAWRLGNNPPRSLGNWSHPLPLVSCPWTVECVVGCRLLQRAAATLSSLEQLSAAWWARLQISSFSIPFSSSTNAMTQDARGQFSGCRYPDIETANSLLPHPALLVHNMLNWIK